MSSCSWNKVMMSKGWLLLPWSGSQAVMGPMERLSSSRVTEWSRSPRRWGVQPWWTSRGASLSAGSYAPRALGETPAYRVFEEEGNTG